MFGAGGFDKRGRRNPLCAKLARAQQRNAGKHAVEEFTPLHMVPKYIVMAQGRPRGASVGQSFGYESGLPPGLIEPELRTRFALLCVPQRLRVSALKSHPQPIMNPKSKRKKQHTFRSLQERTGPSDWLQGNPSRDGEQEANADWSSGPVTNIFQLSSESPQ